MDSASKELFSSGHFHEQSWLPEIPLPARMSLADIHYLVSGGPIIVTGSFAGLSGFEQIDFTQEDSHSRTKKLFSGINEQ